jgi:hypothetical protein
MGMKAPKVPAVLVAWIDRGAETEIRIALTTRSSIKVKADRRVGIGFP